MDTSTTARRMADAAHALLDGLDDAGRVLAVMPFDDTTARLDWHYVPRRRAGLSFRDMGATQQQLAYRLVAAGVSLPAFAAVTTIIGLEDVLDHIENRRRDRHRADYSVSVFGEPGSAAWGWRFEGHHVSVNTTVLAGTVTATPLFLGANPAEVRTGTGLAVVRPLAAEEELASTLVAALPADRRAEATLGDEAPDDILTRNAPTLDALPAGGARLGDLHGSAATTAERLVRHYLDRLPEPDAAAWWKRLQGDYGDVRFAVAGEPDAWRRAETGRRLPQYYRLAGPTLLVEYDNTQNGANHIHTVVRDPSGDFGMDPAADPLRAHRAAHH